MTTSCRVRDDGRRYRTGWAWCGFPVGVPSCPRAWACCEAWRSGRGGSSRGRFSSCLHPTRETARRQELVAVESRVFAVEHVRHAQRECADVETRGTLRGDGVLCGEVGRNGDEVFSGHVVMVTRKAGQALPEGCWSRPVKLGVDKSVLPHTLRVGGTSPKGRPPFRCGSVACGFRRVVALPRLGVRTLIAADGRLDIHETLFGGFRPRQAHVAIREPRDA